MAYQASPESSSLSNQIVKAYVRPLPMSSKDLSEALGHIGVIDVEQSKYHASRPIGFVSARFVINGKPRVFKTWAINFRTIDKTEVPADVLNALDSTNL